MTPAPIIIPAVDPGLSLRELVDAIGATAQRPVILIDDGSTCTEAIALFESLKLRDHVTVITHACNKGKGAAIKSGIEHAQKIDAPFVVTADADGQHLPDDILRIHDIAKTTDRFCVGAREFGPDVPFRSRLGNIVTRALFNLASRNPVTDTQSGLRAIPARWYSPFLDINLNRYEFEMLSLYRVTQQEAVLSVPITTVYEDGNPTSHFRPIIDSSRIYFVLLRYCTVGPTISVAEAIVFFILSRLMDPVGGFWLARSASVAIYFIAMRKVVFRSRDNIVKQAFLYIALVLANVFATSYVIAGFSERFDAPVYGYLLSSIVLAGLNFIIQKRFVFVSEIRN